MLTCHGPFYFWYFFKSHPAKSAEYFTLIFSRCLTVFFINRLICHLLFHQLWWYVCMNFLLLQVFFVALILICYSGYDACPFWSSCSEVRVMFWKLLVYSAVSATLWCGSGFDLSPWCGSEFWFSFDAKPDPGFLFDSGPTFHSDADPDPSFQIKAQTIEKVLK